MRFLLYAVVLVLALSVVEAATISGQVKDEKGEGLPRATIRIEGTAQGVVADNDGKYSLTLDAGSYTLAASYVGYEKVSKSVKLNQNSQQKMDFSLKQTAIQLPEQRVEAERPPLPRTGLPGQQPTPTPTLPLFKGGTFTDYGYLAGLAENARTAAFTAAGISAAKSKAELSKQQGKACTGHPDCEGGVCFGGTCQPKPADALCVESDAGLASEKDNPNVKAGIVVNGIPQYDACVCEYPAGQFTADCEKLGKEFTHVRETSCSEQGKVIACENGCVEGACVQQLSTCSIPSIRTKAGKPVGGLAKTSCAPTCKDDFILVTAEGEKDCWDENSMCVIDKCVKFDSIGWDQGELSYIQNLKNNDPDTRIFYIRRLGEIKSSQSIPFLLRILKTDTKFHVRSWAAGALGEIKKYSIVDVAKETITRDKTRSDLINELKKEAFRIEDVHLLNDISRALSQIGADSSIIAEELRDKNNIIRAKAGIIYGHIEGQKSINVLIGILKSLEDDSETYTYKTSISKLLLRYMDDISVKDNIYLIVSSHAGLFPHEILSLMLENNKLFKRIYDKLSYVDEEYKRNSIAFSVFRRLVDKNQGLSDARISSYISDEEVDLTINQVNAEREEFKKKVILGVDTTAIILAAEDEESGFAVHFDIEPMEKFASDRGVTKIKAFQNANLKNTILGEIQKTKGSTVIWVNSHGNPVKFALRKSDGITVSYTELGDSLKSRGNIHEVILMIDSCFSYNFAKNVNKYLKENEIEPTETIIAASNKGKEAVAYRFLRSLESVSIGNKKPLLGGHIYEAERYSYENYGNDLAVFGGSRSEEIALNSFNHACPVCQEDSCPLETAAG